MARSNAGKARIGILWLVAVGVMFLVALFFAWISQSELTAERLKVADEKQKQSEMTAKLEEELNLRRDLSSLLGWYDRSAEEARADSAAVRKGLEDLKTTFPDIGAAEKDFETAMPRIVAAFGEEQRKSAELQTRIKSLEGELAAAQAATADVTAAKDATISTLQQQLADEQRNAQQRQTEIEGRMEGLRTQLTEREGELRASREEGLAAKRTFEAKEQIYVARNKQLSDDTKLLRAPFSDQPDGRILDVSERLGTGWIDRGANQRIVRGMRFQVKSGRPGDDRLKAWADVTEVKANSAEVRFDGVVDRYDPVVTGDTIVNPIYDPTAERNAVLVGRFSGAYSEQELTQMLTKMGIRVQPRLDLTTHFLIVGSELWNDPETSEPLEEPIQPSDLPTYKEAESQGVQIVPLQDIREYFRVGAGS